MKASQDDSTPQEDPNQAQVWAREPDVPDGEPQCPPAQDDDEQVIDEPGYGHGV